MNSAQHHVQLNTRLKRVLFFQMTGLAAEQLNWQTRQREEIEEFGLDGVYQGIGMAAELLTKEDGELERRASLYGLEGYDFKKRRVLEVGAGVGDKMDLILRQEHGGAVAVEVGFLYAFLRAWYGDACTVRSTLRDLHLLFDVAYCFDVLEHLPHPLYVMARMTELLKRGGLLAVIAPFEDAPGDEYPLHRTEHKEISLPACAERLGLTLVNAMPVTDQYHTTTAYLWEKR